MLELGFPSCENQVVKTDSATRDGGFAMASIRVQFSAQIDDIFVLIPTTELDVAAGVAVEYGLMNEPDPEGRPVVLDAVVEAHKLVVGSAFTPDSCPEYLQMHSRHWLGRAFGKKAFYSGFTINGCYAYDLGSNYSDQGYKGLSFDRARIQEGDVLEVFAFQDSMGMDYYTYFVKDGERVSEIELAVGEQVSLTLEGLMYGYGGPMKREDRRKKRLISVVCESQLVTVDVGTGLMMPIAGAVTDEDEGTVSVGFDAPGDYYLSAIGGEVRYSAHLTFPWLKVHVS